MLRARQEELGKMAQSLEQLLAQHRRSHPDGVQQHSGAAPAGHPGQRSQEGSGRNVKAKPVKTEDRLARALDSPGTPPLSGPRRTEPAA
ncbi:unnamed protein product [Lampetra fluviatilis]